MSVRFSIRWKLLLPLVIVGLALAVFTNVMMVRITIREVERHSVEGAATMVQRVSALRGYYTKNIVARAKPFGLKFAHDYKTHDGVLPLPATMVHELNGLEAKEGTKMRLFSDFPFPWRRESGGLRDDFDKAAWASLKANPDQPFFRMETVDGQPTIRYAVADRMVDQSCVDCHNQHPQSPKVGWKMGDVRGALSVTVPIGARLAAAKTEARKASLVLLLAIAAALGGVMLVLHRSILQPVRKLLDASKRVAAGDLKQRVEAGSRDEMGVLTESFNQMVADIEIRERLVASRTEDLDARNAAMRCVLENVDQGFLSIDRDGKMAAERSAILSRWFPDAGEPNPTLWSYVGGYDANAACWLELGWTELIEGTLPLELSIDQLPKRVNAGDRVLAVEYRPILEGARLVNMLVVISDITEKLAAERGDARQRELLSVFERIVKDKHGFIDFLREADAIVESIVADALDLEVLRRQLHTLKGNAAIFGFNSISQHCHAMENVIDDVGEAPPALEVSELARLWGALRENVATIIGDQDDRVIEIDDVEYEEVLRAVIARAPADEVAKRIRAWKLEPTERVLARIGTQAEWLGKRLGKDFQVSIEDNDLRVDGRKMRTFWSSLVHVIRNSLDHGFEHKEERSAAKKTATGTLRLATYRNGQRLVVEIADDGRGIDWEQVRAKAKRLGLSHATMDDLVGAIFYDGISTRDVVTDVSGRGVGLAAVRAACRELGGTVGVVSEIGRGTSFRFEIPVAVYGGV